MKLCLFPAATSEILRNLICIFFGCFKTKKIVCILVISVMSKYFQMLPIQILPPLLFRTDFPGYRGLQYVHDFLVFWQISSNVRNLYSPAMACLWIPMLTLQIHSQHLRLYLFLPWLEAIISDLSVLMPTHAPPCQSNNSCMSHRPTCGGAHIQNTSGSLEPFVLGCANCWQKAIIYSLGCAHYWQKLSTVEKSSRHCQWMEYQHKRRHTSNILCRIQKNSHCQCCNKICWDIT